MYKLVLIEDETMFRELLALHWIQSREFELIGSFRSIRRALGDSRIKECDVLITDLLLAKEAALSSLKDLRAAAPNARIIVLTGTEDASLLRRAVNAGVDGVVHKQSSLLEIDGLIRRVQHGERILSIPLHHEEELSPVDPVSPTLSRREEEILFFIARGLTSAQIAEKLFISRRTVEKHRENISQKLGLKTLAEMVAWAIRNGYDGRKTEIT
jgi:DNA-binding NarL/FixJ family response regulator